MYVLVESLIGARAKAWQNDLISRMLAARFSETPDLAQRAILEQALLELVEESGAIEYGNIRNRVLAGGATKRFPRIGRWSVRYQHTHGPLTLVVYYSYGVDMYLCIPDTEWRGIWIDHRRRQRVLEAAASVEVGGWAHGLRVH